MSAFAFPSPRRSRLIARTELRRRWRSVREQSPLQLLAIAVVAVFGVISTGAVAFAANFAGGAIADPGTDVGNVLAAARIAFVAVWAFAAFMAVTRAVSNADLDNADGMLTTVPHRDVLGGFVLAEYAVVGGFGSIPVAVAGAAFGVGAGSVAAGVALFLAALAALTTGFLTGLVAGLGVKVLLGRSAFLSRHRTALGAIAMLAYLSLFVTDAFQTVVPNAIGALERTPIAWYADAAFLPVAATSLAATGGVTALTLAAVPALVAAGVALAERLWYADPPAHGDQRDRDRDADAPASESEARSESPRGAASGVRALALADRLPDAVARPTAVVAAKSWLRAVRAPIKLWYVAYPLFLLYVPLNAALDGDGLGVAAAGLPAAVALYGAWLTGAAFTLNPLGDEGAVLPVTVVTGVSGDAFVRGLVLAGATVGVPLTAIATVVAGVALSLPLATVVATAALGAALAVGAAALAAGVGVEFPKFEATSITRSREAVAPSLFAFGAYSLALFVLWIPGSVAGVPPVAEAVAGAASLPPTAVVVAGFGVTVALVGVAGWRSYVHAVATFDEFTV